MGKRRYTTSAKCYSFSSNLGDPLLLKHSSGMSGTGSSTASRSTSLPNVVKWQSVQIVTSGEGLIVWCAKKLHAFGLSVETCVVARSDSPFNNFATTVFAGLGGSVLGVYMGCSVASPPEGPGNLSGDGTISKVYGYYIAFSLTRYVLV